MVSRPRLGERARALPEATQFITIGKKAFNRGAEVFRVSHPVTDLPFFNQVAVTDLIAWKRIKRQERKPAGKGFENGHPGRLGDKQIGRRHPFLDVVDPTQHPGAGPRPAQASNLFFEALVSSCNKNDFEGRSHLVDLREDLLRPSKACPAKEDEQHGKLKVNVESSPYCCAIPRGSERRIDGRSAGNYFRRRDASPLQLPSEVAGRDGVEVHFRLSPSSVHIHEADAGQEETRAHVAFRQGSQLAHPHLGGNHDVWIPFLEESKQGFPAAAVKPSGPGHGQPVLD